MRRRGRKKDDGLVFGLAVFLGVPMFLLMVHPFIFFVAFVPLVIFAIVMLVKWLKK